VSSTAGSSGIATGGIVGVGVGAGVGVADVVEVGESPGGVGVAVAATIGIVAVGEDSAIGASSPHDAAMSATATANATNRGHTVHLRSIG
jgi:hypothetical protein